MAVDADTVRVNLGRVRAELAAAAARAGRDPAAVELLVAVKYVDAGDLAALAEGGVELVGENRTDALIEKQAAAGDRFTWDFIGHLQSRKARDLVGRVRLVHSLATLSAAEQLERRARDPVRCLVEVNLAGEESKSGVPATGVERFLDALAPLGRLQVEGVMTMPPLASEPEASRRYFAELRALAERLAPAWSPRFSFARLSMGTSQDYAVAVEEGATIVRVGSVIYDRTSG